MTKIDKKTENKSYKEHLSAANALFSESKKSPRNDAKRKEME
jgi:hypothetical protein